MTNKAVRIVDKIEFCWPSYVTRMYDIFPFEYSNGLINKIIQKELVLDEDVTMLTSLEQVKCRLQEIQDDQDDILGSKPKPLDIKDENFLQGYSHRELSDHFVVFVVRDFNIKGEEKSPILTDPKLTESLRKMNDFFDSMSVDEILEHVEEPENNDGVKVDDFLMSMPGPVGERFTAETFVDVIFKEYPKLDSLSLDAKQSFCKKFMYRLIKGV